MLLILIYFKYWGEVIFFIFRGIEENSRINSDSHRYICGIYYMLLTSIFTGIISLYLNTWYTGKALDYTFWKQLRDISPSYLTAFVIALAVYF